MNISIIEAIKDDRLFRNFLANAEDKLGTWKNWMVALRVLYGLPVNPKHRDLIKRCTGRDITKLPKRGFKTALFLTGRRSGKSRIASVIGAFEAALSGREKFLAAGEFGMVPILAPTAKQGRVIKSYIRSIFAQTPLLQNEIIKESAEGFRLRNKVQIEILVGDWKTVRGYSCLAVLCDEICFFGLDAESKIKSDTELVRAVQPSLSTTKGRLICISSPYARRGWAYRQYKKNQDNPDSCSTLVWNCDSRTMNPTLSKTIVKNAMEEDRAAALAEYGGQFRDDVVIFLPLETIEACVKRGRLELMCRADVKYTGFIDVSGGRNDDAAFAIGHQDSDNKRIIVDYIKRFRSPHDPNEVIRLMCEQLQKYNIRSVTGDAYSAEFVCQAFKCNGIRYEKCKLPKSGLYLEIIGRICSHEIELLDDKVSINQFANLERRTRSGGKDIICHPQGQHDDSANVISGLAYSITSGVNLLLGAVFRR